MRFEQRVTLPGSERPPAPDSREVSAVPDNQRIEVTIVLRRKNELPTPTAGFAEPRFTAKNFREDYGADPTDIAHLESFAHHAGLTVVETSIPKRRVVLAGDAEAFSQAFGAAIACYQPDDGGDLFRGRTGSLTIPAELEDAVVAVLGIDTRPAAKAHFRTIAPSATATSFTPPQVAALYAFPAGLDGTGQTVAIIELGGGYNTSDLQTYFSNLGVTEPPITAVSVDGGTNSPGGQADGEVMLDIEVIGSIAPGVKIAVYFAPNTDQGFIDAVTDAVHDTARKPSVISISWGGPEESWTAQSQTAMNAALQDAAALGVTVTVAAGDNGSSDGNTDGKLHVDFPASSPYALACGGTTLAGSGATISSEVVWNETAIGEGATGGGISTVFPLPTYQNASNVPAQPQTNFAGRGVPDVAGDADPTTGYKIRVNGQDQVIGGTSAVAPLWAALAALLNQKLGAPVGFLNPKLYPQGESVFQDITSGNNDDSGLGQYSARSGWDACTGLGSPKRQRSVECFVGRQSQRERELGGMLTEGVRSEIPGSAPVHSEDERNFSVLAPDRKLTATIIVRRRPGSSAIGDQLLSGNFQAASREDTAAQLGADPQDISAIEEFARDYDLSVTSSDAGKRTVKVEGSVQDFDRAFGIDLGSFGGSVSYSGPITIPESLAGKIIAVLGLDNRPIARARAQ